RSSTIFLFIFQCSFDSRDIPSFPTRRSSDLFDSAGNLFALDVKERYEGTILKFAPDGSRSVFARSGLRQDDFVNDAGPGSILRRSEEHTSELQSRFDLVCRLLLEKKKNNTN